MCLTIQPSAWKSCSKYNTYQLPSMSRDCNSNSSLYECHFNMPKKEKTAPQVRCLKERQMHLWDYYSGKNVANGLQLIWGKNFHKCGNHKKNCIILAMIQKKKKKSNSRSMLRFNASMRIHENRQRERKYLEAATVVRWLSSLGNIYRERKNFASTRKFLNGHGLHFYLR